MKQAIATLARLVQASIIIAAITFSPAPTYCASPTITPIGVWETPDGDSRIRIEQCGTSLCGNIVWLRDPLEKGGGPALDSKNPDVRLRSRPLIGLPLLHGFVQNSDDPTIWSGGEIYDPTNGKTYSCRITVQDAGTLRVRGFVGLSVLGVTQIWRRLR
jgi:uncharacterized protein (DUF2147 family)